MLDRVYNRLTVTGIEGRLLLSDNGFKRALAKGSIRVTPELTDKSIQPGSLDVRIGEAIIHNTYQRDLEPAIAGPPVTEVDGVLQVTEFDDDPELLYGHVVPDEEDSEIVIHPNGAAKIYFHETIDFDLKNYFLDVDLRSSRGRMGLVIDPRFVEIEGNRRFVVIHNRNPNSIKLYGRSRFAQLFFHPQNDSIPHDGYAVSNPDEAADIASKVVKGSYEMIGHYLVFQAGSFVKRFKENLGIIDTKLEYTDSMLYNTEELGEVMIAPNTATLLQADPALELPGDIGIRLLTKFPINPKYVTIEDRLRAFTIANAVWFDPGFKGNGTLHPRSLMAHLHIKKGDGLALGIFYKYTEPVGLKYGLERGSHYQGSKGDGFKS
ncbi:MAG: hypothetical protein ACE5FT_02860 [Candidatus Nanoarchaeia archaeon]